MFKLISTTAAVFGALAVSAGAAAAAEGVKVAYGDLDLASEAGAAKFDQRAKQAARSYCRSQPLPMSTYIRDMRGCVADIHGGLVEALPQAERQAYASARSRSTTAVLASR